MYYIGIDLGGTNVAIGIVNEKMELIKKGSVPTQADKPDAIVADMAALCRRLLEEEGIALEEVAYVGIATPGAVDHAKGEVICANNIPFRHYPLAAKLQAILPVPAVYVENDANAAALGEAKAGAAHGANNVIMITLGTGVGGGVIIDGKVYKGANGVAGELGHVVIEKHGRPCSCGRVGCWEAYSSATGLINMTREKMAECPDSYMHTWAEKEGKVSGRTAFEAMRTGDKAAAEVVDMYISYLACGIGNMINIFQPEAIVIGGGISNEGENLLSLLRPILPSEYYGGDIVEPPEICIATLGNDAGILGAAYLGLK